MENTAKLNLLQQVPTMLNPDLPTYDQAKRELAATIDRSPLIEQVQTEFQAASIAYDFEMVEEKVDSLIEEQTRATELYQTAFTDGILSKLIELGLNSVVKERAVSWYDKWHTFDTVADLIVDINNSRAVELAIPTITPRSLRDALVQQDKKQSSQAYTDFIKMRREVKTKIAKGKSKIKELKSISKADLEILKAKQAGEVALLKAEHVKQISALETKLELELVELDAEYGCHDAPATFDEYKERYL